MVETDIPREIWAEASKGGEITYFEISSQGEGEKTKPKMINFTLNL